MEWTKGDSWTDGDAAAPEDKVKQWMDKVVQVH